MYSKYPRYEVYYKGGLQAKYLNKRVAYKLTSEVYYDNFNDMNAI